MNNSGVLALLQSLMQMQSEGYKYENSSFISQSLLCIKEKSC